MLNGRTIFWIVVSGSAALARPPLLLDSKALRSEFDIFATSARGSCRVDPGPVPLRMVTLSASSMGVWLNSDVLSVDPIIY